MQTMKKKISRNRDGSKQLLATKKHVTSRQREFADQIHKGIEHNFNILQPKIISIKGPERR